MSNEGQDERWDLIVVGGGLEGLTAAWAHAAADRRVLVLEATGEPGGRARTIEADGYLVEEELPLLSPAAFPLVDAVLGTDGLARPAPPIAAAGLLGPRHRIRPHGSLAPGRVVAGLRTLAPVAVDDRLPLTAQGFARRLGESSGAGPFTEAATRATYGVGAEVVGAGDAYPEAVAAKARHRRRPLALGLLHPCLDPGAAVVRGGSARLAQALADAEHVTVRTGCRVTAVRGGEHVVVASEQGAFRARSTLLAVDATAQARLLAVDRPVAAEALSVLPHATRLTVHLGLSADSARRLPRRMGLLSLDPRAARLRGAAFVTHVDPTRAPPDHGLVQAWFGDGPGNDLEAYDDHLLARIATADLARGIGYEPEVVFRRVTRRAGAHPVPVPGLRGRMARVQAALGGVGIGLLGRHARGVGLTARLGIHVLRTRPLPAEL